MIIIGESWNVFKGEVGKLVGFYDEGIEVLEEYEGD
jgi:hypothetical protein